MCMYIQRLLQNTSTYVYKKLRASFFSNKKKNKGGG